MFDFSIVDSIEIEANEKVATHGPGCRQKERIQRLKEKGMKRRRRTVNGDASKETKRNNNEDDKSEGR